MPHIEILGPGCANCNTLFQRAEQAARELGLEFTIEKVTDIHRIVGYRVLTTPAMVVDGQVKVAGRVPTAEALKELLR